ncbi:hypothetical protein KX816_18390 [Sphingosinicellaceae bacterium]|nr:hypothetical protein KX816_18390 [Sphingosinicellaceae bacterium]
MLLQHIDDSGSHLFVGDIRDGYLFVLLTRAMFERGGHINPLWGRAATDRRTFDELGRWLSIRRDQWPAWGRLAEAVDHEAVGRHMSKLLTETPIAEVIGTVVRKHEDPVEVVFGEMLFSRNGTDFEEVYRHRFTTSAARDRFRDWMFTHDNIH